jgi:hypothetical protein
MTRGGTDALKEQLWAEALRHGLGRANEVLIVADGAAWIWNLAGDRLVGARQRVDFYHVSQHLICARPAGVPLAGLVLSRISTQAVPHRSAHTHGP